VLQGVHTTLVLALPRLGSPRAHIQLEKVFLFLGSLPGPGPAQLFPARYLYPDAHWRLANLRPPSSRTSCPPRRVAYPAWTANPTPGACWPASATGSLLRIPFRAAGDSMQDFTLHDQENRAMLLPSGRRSSPVTARLALTPPWTRPATGVGLDRDGFEDATCLLRGAVTHDGLPFQLPVAMQPWSSPLC